MIEIRPEERGDITANREVNRRAFGADIARRRQEASRGRARHVQSGSTWGPHGAALGPLAGVPEEQGHGIGTRLVEAGNERLAAYRTEFTAVESDRHSADSGCKSLPAARGDHA